MHAATTNTTGNTTKYETERPNPKYDEYFPNTISGEIMKISGPETPHVKLTQTEESDLNDHLGRGEHARDLNDHLGRDEHERDLNDDLGEGVPPHELDRVEAWAHSANMSSRSVCAHRTQFSHLALTKYSFITADSR